MSLNQEKTLRLAKDKEIKANKLKEAAQKLLADAQKAGKQIKEELDELFSEEAADEDRSTEQILSNRGMASLQFTHINKIRKFSNGENFSRFCERFTEYVYITKICDKNLYLFFLQNVDDMTYSTLKMVKLENSAKCDANIFCDIYKKEIYGDESLSLKNEVLNCRQKADETISQYTYRLREKANIAYLNSEIADENCLLAFLRGVKSNDMKIKLNEAFLDNFNVAVKMAKKIERVGGMLGKQPEVVPILQQAGFNRGSSNSEGRGRRRSSEGYESDPEQLNRSNVKSNSTDRYYRHSRDSNRTSNNRYKNRQNFGRRRPITCWGCGKQGHKFAVCWGRSSNYSLQGKNVFPWQYSNWNNNNMACGRNSGFIEKGTRQGFYNGQNYNPYSPLN